MGCSQRHFGQESLVFDARDIVGRVKRQAQNGVVLLKPHDFYVDASIRSSIFCYGTRPARLRQIPARFCEAHRDDRLAEWSFDDATFNRTAAAFNNPDHVAIVIHNYL